MAITEFRGEYRFLSNFWPCDIKYEGVTYPSTEHAYQAAKTLNKEERYKILACRKPADAKRLGSKVTLRKEWSDENYRIQIMTDLNRQKYADIELCEKLLATGDEELIEGNDWGDRWWGQVDGVGRNELGKILMRIRKELRSGASYGGKEV